MASSEAAARLSDRRNTYRHTVGPAGKQGASQDAGAYAGGLVTPGTSRFVIENEYGAPGWTGPWGYGMWSWRRGAYDVSADEEHRRQFFRSVRETGYTTLRPAGVAKTMQQLLDEADASDDEAIDMDAEAEAAGMADGPLDGHHGVEENELAPGTEEDDDGQDLDGPPVPIDASGLGTPPPPGSADDGSDPAADEDSEVDLDADIPEAEDNDYDDYYGDDGYDDNEYDEGFVASEEEYEASGDEGNLTIPAIAGSDPAPEPAPAPAPVPPVQARRRASSIGARSVSSLGDEDMSLV